jgi:hypothetical protein
MIEHAVCGEYKNFTMGDKGQFEETPMDPINLEWGDVP